MKRLSVKSCCAGLLFALSTMALFHPVRALAQAGQTEQAPFVNAAPSAASATGGGDRQQLPQGQPRLRIGPGDLLEVGVFDTPELTQAVRVNDLGDASFGLIGRLHVAGLTPEEAQASIARKLKDGNYLLDPQVSVLIREYSTQGVSVLGEVKKPGVYGVLGSQSLLDVIAAAGGITPFAGPDVTVKRYADDTTLTVRISKDAKASLASDIQLHPGDKVIIPRAGLVYVIGDVGRPGGFIMENDGRLSLLQALAMAGGNNQTASLRHARLIRKTASGYTETPIPLKKIMLGAQADPQLETEDILYIPSNAAKTFVYRSVPSIINSTSAAAVYHSMP